MTSRIAVAFLSVLFGPFGVLCLAWSTSALATSEYLTAAVALGFCVFALGFTAFLAIVASGRVTPRITYDDTGTTLRPDRNVDLLLVSATLGVFVAMTIYAIFTPLGLVKVPVPHADQRYFVFCCAAAALAGLPSLWHIVAQRGMSRLRLTADGLDIGTAVSSKNRPWDDVTEIADTPRDGGHPGGTTYVKTADGRTRTLVSDWYVPEGHTLREAMRFYWQHPEHRDELNDGRIVSRLGRGS